MVCTCGGMQRRVRAGLSKAQFEKGGRCHESEPGAEQKADVHAVVAEHEVAAATTAAAAAAERKKAAVDREVAAPWVKSPSPPVLQYRGTSEHCEDFRSAVAERVSRELPAARGDVIRLFGRCWAH